MKLYLVQHAEAKKEEEDPARPLAERGWRDLEKVSRFLKERKIEVARILHSGKLRAKQTAEKLGEAVRSSEGVKETNGLAPSDDPSIWERKLREETVDILLVGHLPHLSRLAGLMLAHNLDLGVIDFKMGGVVCLDRDDEGNWSVSWMVTPQIL